MEEGVSWKTNATDTQVKYFDTLGSRPYDEIAKSDTFILKKKVGFATCGPPSELPSFSNYFTGYKKEELMSITTICNKIIKKSDHDPIRFTCVMLVLHHQGATCTSPVFKIETNSGIIFIDPYARVYKNWKDFKKHNKLPECEYCYPENGEYSPEKKYLCAFTKSPARKMVNKASAYLDKAGSMASLGVASVTAAGMVVHLTPAVVVGAGLTAVVVGVYGASKGIGSLIDRTKHDQSIGLKDRASRAAWMAVGGSVTGIATLGGLEKARYLVECGKSLSTLGNITIQTLNVTAFVFIGYGFVNSVVAFGDKYKKGGRFTRKDIFDISCEILFLFNATVALAATAALVSNMHSAVANASVSQRAHLLTRHGIRNFRRRKPRRVVKGLTPLENTTKSDEDSSITRGKSDVQFLLIEAANVYLPRDEEISLRSQFIGHEIACWKHLIISDDVLINNLRTNLAKLNNEYKDEIAESAARVERYFDSITFQDLKKDMHKFFRESGEENKYMFCTKVINTEDLLDAILSTAERDIFDLQERLKSVSHDIPPKDVEGDSSIFDAPLEDNTATNISSSNREMVLNAVRSGPPYSVKDDLKVRDRNKANSKESLDLNESDLNHEVERVFTKCGYIFQAYSLTCRNLEDFGDVLDAVKYVVSEDFKGRMFVYKVSLDMSISNLGDSFEIETFQKIMNVPVKLQDVVSYMFNKTLQDLTVDSVKKLKIQLHEIKKKRDLQTIQFWESVADGAYQFYKFFGNRGTGHLARESLISIASKTIGVSLSEKNCKSVGDEDVVMIEVKDKPDLYVVVYSEVTELNSASSIIHVVK